ncbi:MAG: hypothetical protein MI802_15330 [Desulfobacterales bacterium]|nr:hypothetical protein [Desulfobacterales bacterium]
MRRRRRTAALGSVLTQDPGKDLFAYLFLLIMVFAFMLLMSFEQKDGVAAAQTGPEQNKSDIRGPRTVSRDQVARLVKEGDTLLLRYGSVVYDPATDVERLTDDGRIVTVTGDNGDSRQFLYIEKQGRGTISLFEYLDTFQVFSRHQVAVAFAREVK